MWFQLFISNFNSSFIVLSSLNILYILEKEVPMDSKVNLPVQSVKN